MDDLGRLRREPGRLVSMRLSHVEASGTKEATALVTGRPARWEQLENGRYSRQASVRHEQWSGFCCPATTSKRP